MGNVEWLETFRCRGVVDREEFVVVHIVGSTVRILGDQAQGFVLGAQAEAQDGRKDKRKNFFHMWQCIGGRRLCGSSAPSSRI